MGSHNEQLYREIDPQKVEDVQHAYEQGWITIDQMERDLEEVLNRN